MITEDQAAVVTFLASPGALGGEPVETIETHASIVFLSGRRAWKLKRAVRYNYLDFSTADRRRAMCEADCGPILVWLPEGEQAESVNYAFLFEAEGRVHLYDFTILAVSYIDKAAWLRPQQILFDKTGVLAKAAQRPEPRAFKPEGLAQQIDIWWVYTYLNGKYYKRCDAYKMLYVQQVIFQTHMRVLHALHSEAEWHWWARDIHTLPQAQQDELMVYFSAHEPDDIGRALGREMDLFSRDAQAACAKWQVAYPAELERGVREHLAYMGVTP